LVDSLLWRPGHRILNLANIFAQTRIPLGDTVELTVGLKLGERSLFRRLAHAQRAAVLQVTDRHMLWAAISRAVRHPHALRHRCGGETGSGDSPDRRSQFFAGTGDAYEAAIAGNCRAQVTLSISAYQNVYENLKSIEGTPVVVFPLKWGQHAAGQRPWRGGLGSFQATTGGAWTRPSMSSTKICPSHPAPAS